MFGRFEIVVLVLLVIATLTDLKWGKIHNALSFSFLGTGLVCQFFLVSSNAFHQGLLAVAVAFILFFPLWILRVFGAGDVKLLMAVGAWTDIPTVLRIAAVSIVIGTLVGLVVLIRKRGLKGGLLSIGNHLQRNKDVVSERMPFAPAFLCAFFVTHIAEIYHWEFGI